MLCVSARLRKYPTIPYGMGGGPRVKNTADCTHDTFLTKPVAASFHYSHLRAVTAADHRITLSHIGAAGLWPLRPMLFTRTVTHTP